MPNAKRRPIVAGRILTFIFRPFLTFWLFLEILSMFAKCQCWCLQTECIMPLKKIKNWTAKFQLSQVIAGCHRLSEVIAGCRRLSQISKYHFRQNAIKTAMHNFPFVLPFLPSRAQFLTKLSKILHENSWESCQTSLFFSNYGPKTRITKRRAESKN